MKVTGRNLRRWSRVVAVITLSFCLRSTFSFVHQTPFFGRSLCTNDARSQCSVLFRESSGGGNWEQNIRQLRSIQEQQTNNALTDALFEDDASATQLLPIHLNGQARLPVVTNQTRRTTNRITLVLTQEPEWDDSSVVSALLLPLASVNQLKLVSFAQAKRPLSQSILLGLNTLLVNRDGALFDNLPWSEWSIDPQRRNRDAAGNPVNSKFHLGKRDAYNRFMGKDWQGRSLAIGNVALRLKYLLEETSASDRDGDDGSPLIDQEESRISLATRVLQLQLRELRMELADVESQLAISRNNEKFEGQQALEEDRRDFLKRIEETEADITCIVETPDNASSGVSSVLKQIADWTTDNGQNAAPYRGAMGYAPMLDSKRDIEDSRLPYTSPYDLLKEILKDQLNAKVIACVLENTSLLKGNLALGGAVVLQRVTPLKKATVAGEAIEYNDYDEDFGNEGVPAGETMIVECDSDEAIGVALAYMVPLKVQSGILERASTSVEPACIESDASTNIIEVLSLWRTVDPEMNLQAEGEAQLSQKASPISIPRTTTSLFEGPFDEKPAGSSLFPTDNPIKSLGELDGLSNEDKAKTLLEMSNFSMRLPRPRVVKKSETNPLDELLVPLIDESVRRQYYIRDAEQRGDFSRAEELRAEKSQLQVAKENADVARQEGRENTADRWETEAEFLESLRADVTQSEGAYSRFLDRDYWYEKDRQATSKRVDKSKFGNLLDGIE